MGLKVITQPTTEPVTLDEIKAHLRYDGSTQDDMLAALIRAARQTVEAETSRSLLTQTLCYTLDAFPDNDDCLQLPGALLQDIESIVYIDGARQSQTLESFQVDTNSEPGRVAPSAGYVWPDTDEDTLNAVTITYVAGWESADDVPEELKHVIKLLVGHWFDNTQAVTMEGTPKEMPFAVRALLSHWKVPYIG